MGDLEIDAPSHASKRVVWQANMMYLAAFTLALCITLGLNVVKSNHRRLAFTKSSFMYKRGDNWGSKGWRRRFLILDNDVVSYHNTETEITQKVKQKGQF